MGPGLPSSRVGSQAGMAAGASGGYFSYGLNKKGEPNKDKCWGSHKMKEALPFACLLNIARCLTPEVPAVG